jgi:hypothetical protein
METPDKGQVASGVGGFRDATGKLYGDVVAERNGSATPAPGAKDGTKEQPAGSDKDAGGEVEQTPTPKDTSRSARARAALKRDGLSDEEIDALATKDEKSFEERGLKREKVWATSDRERSELRKLQRASKEASTKTKESPTPDETPLDFDAALTPLLKELELNEQTAAPLKALLKTLDDSHKQRYAKLEQGFNDLRDSMGARDAENGAEAMQSARAEVGKEFPDLLENEGLQEEAQEYVEANFKLAKYQEHKTVPDLLAAVLRDFCKSNDVERKDPAEVKRMRNLRANGAPESSPRKTAVKVSPQEQFKRSYEYVRTHPNESSEQRIRNARRYAGIDAD